MSLMRQLWLAVVISTVVAFAGSLSISIWSARGYLVQELERKNSDNATSLALAMTQQEKDPVNIDLQVAALFDTGYYQEISVVDPLGKVIAQRLQDKVESHVPAWFVKMLPIPSTPGQAQVSDGWKQYATVNNHLLDLRDGSMQRILNDPTAEEFAWDSAGRRLADSQCSCVASRGV